MVDTGCSRTCVKSNQKFLRNVELQKSNARIKCANDLTMDTAGIAPLQLYFKANFKPSADALVVDNLSFPLILVMDIIKSISFGRNSPSIEICGIKLRTVDPNLETFTAYAAEKNFTGSLLRIKSAT